MDVIDLKPKELMPGVILDKYSNIFRFYGTSCPMEPNEFYDPIIEWFNNYSRDPLPETVIEIYFNYFDTASSKFLLHIFYKLEDIQDAGYDVMIKWYYSFDDDDMLEEAEEFESVVYLDFDMIPIENEDDAFEDDVFFEDVMASIV